MGVVPPSSSFWYDSRRGRRRGVISPPLLIDFSKAPRIFPGQGGGGGGGRVCRDPILSNRAHNRGGGQGSMVILKIRQGSGGGGSARSSPIPRPHPGGGGSDPTHTPSSSRIRDGRCVGFARGTVLDVSMGMVGSLIVPSCLLSPPEPARSIRQEECVKAFPFPPSFSLFFLMFPFFLVNGVC